MARYSSHCPIKGENPPASRGLHLWEGMSEQRALRPGKSRMVPPISDPSCMLLLSQNFLLDLGPCSSAPSPHAKQIVMCPGCDGAVPAAWDWSSGMWDDWLPSTEEVCSAGNAVVYTHTAHSHPLPTASQLKPQPY